MLKQIQYTLLISLIIYFCGCQSPSVSLKDFPEIPQNKLGEYKRQISTKGGAVLAGRVRLSDGSKIQGPSDVQVNFKYRGDRPCRVYENGLFLLDRALPQKYAGSGHRKLVIRAFGYEPIDDSVTLIAGEVTYLNYTMEEVPSNRLGEISGVVRDEKGKPLAGVNVALGYPYANYGMSRRPYRKVKTKSDGCFQFTGLESAEFSLTASAPKYAYHNVKLNPVPGKNIEQNLRLFPHRTITLKYVYQGNGRTDFTSGDFHRGELTWTDNQGGVDFSDGKVERYEPESLRDLELRLEQGQLQFDNFYVNGNNGFYDAGDKELDEVTEAGKANYSTRSKSCRLGHVYVVKTYEGHYAKFKVVDIEQ